MKAVTDSIDNNGKSKKSPLKKPEILFRDRELEK